MSKIQPTPQYKKNNSDHSTIREHYFGTSTSMATTTVAGLVTTTTLQAQSPTETPRAPDQQQDLQSKFKRSVPLIIFMTATIGGIFILIVLGILLLRCKKKRKERKQVEHHEQWLARQNLDREEERAKKVAFGGWFGQVQGVQGRDFAAEGGGARGRQGDGSGMELRAMGRERQWR